jgi:putative transposase
MQRFVRIEELFKGRHFDRQIIVLCVSWYTSFKLSLRDLLIMMADRGDLRDPYNDPAVRAALPSRV